VIRRCLLALLTLVLAACAVEDRPAPPPARPPDVAAIPPAREAPLPEAPPAVAPIALPAGAIYVCVVDKAGAREQTVIDFAPKVHELCRRHPEMGPCQYERNQCRAAGGRVYAGGGEEITLAREAEYDKKVLRVRFRAN